MLKLVSFIVALGFVCGDTWIFASRDRSAAGVPDAAFVLQTDSAMAQMMSAMDVKPTGDADRDFVASMVPHHQGAIDMAMAILRYGHNEQLQRLAQEIIVTQREEITAMRLAIGDRI